MIEPGNTPADLQDTYIFPALETPRLWLRQLLATDAPAIAGLRSDEQVNKYLGRQGQTNVEEAATFINNINEGLEKNQSFYWVATLKPASALVGTICLWNLVPEKGEIEIGFELLPAFQGKGIMQEAVEAVLRYGFETLQLQQVNGFTHKENQASVKVLQRNLFKRDDLLDTGNEVELVGYSLTSTVYHAAGS